MAEKKPTLDFETALKKLEEIVRQLESGNASLEESITLYEKGNQLKDLCQSKLNDAQLRVKKITLDANKRPTATKKFDAE